MIDLKKIILNDQTGSNLITWFLKSRDISPIGNRDAMGEQMQRRGEAESLRQTQPITDCWLNKEAKNARSL